MGTSHSVSAQWLWQELNLLWSESHLPQGALAAIGLVGGALELEVRAGAWCELGLPVFPVAIVYPVRGRLGPRLLELKP